MSGTRRVIGVIGGSGVDRVLGDGERTMHRVATPWGAPSAPIMEGHLGDLTILFLPRHGVGHTIPPHRVNYRANVDALKSLGADSILTVSSVGSLQAELPPGTFVLPDQFVDFTKSRPTTFFDGGRVYHVSLADPFCPEMSRHAADAGARAGHSFATGKTYVCVEGPRFSTRAESKFLRGFADVIGMTLVPEVTLARERAMCYSCLAMVTDFDVWADRPVNAKEIVETMAKNVDRMQDVLGRLLPTLAGSKTCECELALESAGL
ncbi:MAG: S-methyl-5'-thioadenosine phosphorylase [Thermoplasmata archaeon]|nr:S-methyl-5'-thioadenosine phosphorylase [Thermoplasmata archaeon]MCI4356215.1 S-methyl-5'-thioadenosine phosphorylase [Thermoplasmata archaeon]